MRISDWSSDVCSSDLDYAATDKRGLNFHDPRGNLTRPYPFSELREDALSCAYRLVGLGVRPQDRIALVAETGSEDRTSVAQGTSVSVRVHLGGRRFISKKQLYIKLNYQTQPHN